MSQKSPPDAAKLLAALDLRVIRGPKANGNRSEESAGTSKSTHGNE